VRNRLFDSVSGPGTSSGGAAHHGGHGADTLFSDGDASEVSDTFMEEKEEFLEDRRWAQAREAAVCDLCNVPWVNDESLYCEVCGYGPPRIVPPNYSPPLRLHPPRPAPCLHSHV
jgi:hypothetical protein